MVPLSRPRRKFLVVTIAHLILVVAVQFSGPKGGDVVGPNGVDSAFGHYAGYRPDRAGLGDVALGIVMAALTIAFGG